MVLGTLVSNEAVLAALIGVAVATAVRFAGCFGGYFGASVSPLILAYVLAATVPAPADAVTDRLLGWLVAGAISTVAALVLWPRRERLRIREAAAELAGVVAVAASGLATPEGPSPESVTAVRDAVMKLGDAASVPRRPAGPSAHDAALAFLVDELERAAFFVAGASSSPATASSTELAPVAAKRSARSRRRCARGRWPMDLDELVAACIDAKHEVVERAIDELARDAEPGTVLEEIDACFPERLLLLVAASALVNASVLVSGRGPSNGAASIPLETAAAGDRRGRDHSVARPGRGERGVGISMGPGEPARRRRGRRRDPHRGGAAPRPRLLGGARHALGPPLQRVRDGTQRAHGVVGDGDRVRGLRGSPRARRHPP